MSIKIIGAGFPRTGTSTLKSSLEHLGYVKTYHMKELIVNPTRLPYWLELEQTRSTDWDALYEGYQASVDFPGYPYYKEQMERYPDAKVILTVRPFDKWYASANATVRKAAPQTIGEKLSMLVKMIKSARVRQAVGAIKMFERIFWTKTFHDKFDDKEYAEKIFNDHIADVKAHVPPEKLLVYDVRDGWGPLCAFLGVPEPDQPLPHKNKKENFKAMLGKLLQGEMV